MRYQNLFFDAYRRIAGPWNTNRGSARTSPDTQPHVLRDSSTHGSASAEANSRRIILFYQALIEKAPDGFVLLNGEGNFKFISPAAKRMFGYGASEEVPGTPQDYTHPDDLMMILSNLAQLFADPAFVPTLQYRFAEKSGKWKWVESTFSNLLSDPNVEAIVINFHDITERKRLEHQLLQAQKLEGVGTLAGGIAHDFNNLLAIIMGSAELLRQCVAEQPQLKKYVDRIIEASERGSSISRQLLIFSRPDQVKLEPVSLIDILTEVGDLLLHFLPKSIVVKISTEECPGTIMGDAGQIHQAMLNLALNAGDAMANRGTLTIRQFAVSSESVASRFNVAASSPFVAVSMTDTGIGMNEQLLEKIFDPFFSTKERGKGTGLGLAMVQGIMKNHNGFVDVISVPGEGATFTLYFPAHSSSVERSVSVEPAEAQAIPNRTILLADDEPMILDMLSEFLTAEGHTIVAARDGIEALEIYHRQYASIDLVVTDLGMPRMGGEELFMRMKEIRSDVRVLMTSGYLDGITKDHLLELGIADVVIKPVKLHEIQNAIRGALNAEAPHAMAAAVVQDKHPDD